MWPLYAFDNYFVDADRIYSIEEQWDIPRAIGYDLVYLSISRTNAESWKKLEQLAVQRRRTGMGLAAVFAILDLQDPQPADHRSIIEIIEHLESGDVLDLAITAGWAKDLSDSAHDERALHLLRPMMESARARGVTLSLYHHYNFWLERIEDCVRLVQKANDDVLRVTFCASHWYAVDGSDLAGKLELARPWLCRVNLSGGRPCPEGFAGVLPTTIEPVGDGTFPLYELIGSLRHISYSGPVGFQGYKIGGIPADTLARSLNAFRAAELGEVSQANPLIYDPHLIDPASRAGIWKKLAATIRESCGSY